MGLIEKMEATIEKHRMLESGNKVVVGISGGPDSVCLLHGLHRLSSKWDLKLIGVHINHHLRGEAADQDQKYAEALCARLEIPCRTFHFDVKAMAREQGLSTEDAGRRVRYQSFFQVASGQAKIAVAQNQDDQAETVLMRIMRGTGIEGLSGIEYSRPDGVIRPLLDISRREIERYCEDAGLVPQIDKTNLEPVYTRNRIRLELLPYMREHFNENVTEALTRLAAIAREEGDYLEWEADKLIHAHGEGNTFPVEVLSGLHPALRKRVMAAMLKKAGATMNVTSLHLNQADLLVMKKKSSAAMDFPENCGMAISYGQVRFYKKNQQGENEAAQNELGNLRQTVIVRENFDLTQHVRGGSLQVKSFDFDAVKAKGQPLVLRTRREGDFIRPLGMTGRKKLQDYFVDKKIKREERDQIPLVAIGSEILWVVGGQISENFKVKTDSKAILLLEYTKKM